MESPAFIAAPVQAAPAPFTLGRVLGRTFAIWGQNLLAFSILVLVLHAPSLALMLIAGPPPTPGTSDLSYNVLNLANAVVGGLLSFVSAGALTQGALRSMAGHRVSPGELLAAGFRTLGRVFAASLNAGLRIVLWSFLLVIPGIIAMCRYFVAVPAAVAEPGLSSSEAVERSTRLTEGHRLPIFVVLLVVYFATLSVNLLLATVGLRSGMVSYTVFAVATWAVGAIGSGLWATSTGVAYHDLRLEKEGASTEQLAAVFE